MTYSDDVIAHHQRWCNYDVIGLVYILIMAETVDSVFR